MKQFTVVLLLLLSTSIWAQPDLSNVEIETINVADNIYILVGSGGNIGVSIGDDGVFLIDDQFAQLSDKNLAAIAALTDEDIEFLVNTHYHGDHTGGNIPMVEAGAIIVAHDNVRERLMVDQERPIYGRGIRGAAPLAWPVVTFSEEMTFHWNDDTINVIHVPPAHTDGDSILHFEEANVLHMGDAFFSSCYPFVDVDSGGDINGFIAAGELALSLSDENTKIIPGHGLPAGTDVLTNWLEVVVATRDNVQALIDQGMSEADVIAAKPNAAYDEQYAIAGCAMNSDIYSKLLYNNLIR